MICVSYEPRYLCTCDLCSYRVYAYTDDREKARVISKLHRLRNNTFLCDKCFQDYKQKKC